MTEVDVTIGVDFAASAKNTAACRVHWHAGEAVVVRVETNVDDEAFSRLLDSLPSGDRLGLDCPLGWPVDFVAAVRAHGAHEPWPARGLSADRASLRWRETDREMHRRYGRWPLSVSTDLIGVTALRAARVLDAWEAGNGPIDRAGLAGPIVEVYPAMARRVWGLGPVRSLAEVEASVPIRFLEAEARRQCDAVEHVFDALVAALVARAATLGCTIRPSPDQIELAAVEGWIHVPTRRLRDLTL